MFVRPVYKYYKTVTTTYECFANPQALEGNAPAYVYLKVPYAVDDYPSYNTSTDQPLTSTSQFMTNTLFTITAINDDGTVTCQFKSGQFIYTKDASHDLTDTQTIESTADDYDTKTINSYKYYAFTRKTTAGEYKRFIPCRKTVTYWKQLDESTTQSYYCYQHGFYGNAIRYYFEQEITEPGTYWGYIHWGSDTNPTSRYDFVGYDGTSLVIPSPRAQYTISLVEDGGAKIYFEGIPEYNSRQTQYDFTETTQTGEIVPGTPDDYTTMEIIRKYY